MIPLLGAPAVPSQGPAASKVAAAGAIGTEELLGVLLGVSDAEQARLVAHVRRWTSLSPELREAVERITGVAGQPLGPEPEVEP
jgi:hypothetical protein